MEWAVRSGVACEVECGVICGVEWFVEWSALGESFRLDPQSVGTLKWGPWAKPWRICGVHIARYPGAIPPP